MAEIVVKNVSVLFSSKKREVLALDNFSATFQDGMNVIIGYSGCGKSTLLRSILGLIDYDGDIYPDGAEHDAILGIRGENIVLDASGLTTTPTIKEILGNTTQMFVKVAPEAPDCIVCLSERNDIQAGDEVKIKFDERKLHFFDKETEFSIMGRERA